MGRLDGSSGLLGHVLGVACVGLGEVQEGLNSLLVYDRVRKHDHAEYVNLQSECP